MMQNPLSTLETREDRSGITGFFARLGDAVGRSVMHSLPVEPTVVASLRDRRERHKAANNFWSSFDDPRDPH